MLQAALGVLEWLLGWLHRRVVLGLSEWMAGELSPAMRRLRCRLRLVRLRLAGRRDP